jgi:aspartyl aminopeptidase
MDDVWKLETPEQDEAIDYINFLYHQATEYRSVSARNFLKRLYEDSWETIKERMEAEGSIWYVWYMDGVNKLIIAWREVSI